MKIKCILIASVFIPTLSLASVFQYNALEMLSDQSLNQVNI